MTPVAFDEANGILDKPRSMTRDDCEAINVWRGNSTDGTDVVISCWKLTKEEIEQLVNGGRLWLWIAGQTMPPVLLSTERPWP